MHPIAKGENCLQTYFEQQDDKEAASIVASVVALLSSNNSVASGRREEEYNSIDRYNNQEEMNNILLTKESEISALKEVIFKWRHRALEALDQLETIQIKHDTELKSMESRYKRKLEEKEDTILNLRDQVDYLIVQHSRRSSGYEEEYPGDTTDSIVSDFDDDIQSIVSSIYDRDVEQKLVQDSLCNGNLTRSNLKSETVLDSIQDTMRAIEQELNNKIAINSQDQISTSRMYHHGQHRRSPTYGSAFSSSTLIDSDTSQSKKIKKSPFFINRIFKKAFPKLYKKKNINKKKQYPASLLFNDDPPRNSTDESLGVYSTTTTVTSEQQHVLNLLSTF